MQNGWNHLERPFRLIFTPSPDLSESCHKATAIVSVNWDSGFMHPEAKKQSKKREFGMKSRWLKIMGMLLTLTVFLTGCIDAKMHITVNRNGSGIYEIEVLTNHLLLSQFDNLKNRLAVNGYQIRTEEKGDKEGWVAVKRVESVVDDPPGKEFREGANAAFRFFSHQTASLNGDGHLFASDTPNLVKGLSNGFKVKNRLFTTTLIYDNHVDLTSLKQKDLMGLDQLVFDQMNLRFILTLPVKVDKNNATTVSPDGKTLTWKIRPGTDNPIYMVVIIPNPITWGILILLLIVLFVVGLIWFIRRRKRRNGTPPSSGQRPTEKENHAPDSFRWG
jgi:hypothetical protein